MYEELYVIKDGERYQLDLNTPSGITLNFKSNIFGDLSKISCSYTYTFKLPVTVNNRRVLDMAEDLRHSSDMIRKRLKCEFLQNGIPLFSNANLYIDSVESNYNAVMTWGVVDGFETLKDNDCPLGELTQPETIVQFGSRNYEAIGSSSNSASVLQPEYDCGLPYRIMSRTIYDGYRNSTYYHTYKYKDERFTALVGYGAPVPYPVVPIKHLIDLINAQFNLNIDLSKSFNYSELTGSYDRTQRFDVIKRGVIPCTEKNQKYNQLVERSLSLSSLGFTNDNVYGNTLDKVIYGDEGGDEIKSVMSFGIVGKAASCPFDVPSGTPRYYIIPQINNLGATCYGRLLVKFKNYHVNTGGRHPGAATRGDSSSTEDGPVLSIVQQRTYRAGAGGANGTLRAIYKIVQVASFTGENVGTDHDGYYVFEFDFREFEGLEELSLSDLTSNNRLFFTFNEEVATIHPGGSIELIPDYEKCLTGQPIDVYESLPDISCMTFVKGLFYMLGAFPTSTLDGKIVPVFYDDIRANLSVALDWSAKVSTDAQSLPIKTVFKAGDVAQRNYYLMKSDNLESDAEEEREETDIYASGVGVVTCENELLEKEKTVITLPYSAPYLMNKKTPRYETGKTFKAWEYVAKEFKACKPNPIVGLIDIDTVVTNTRDITTGNILSTSSEARWTMTCWNGFQEMAKNASFAYMQSLFENPYVITEYLNLNEFDLRDIDYTVPVYLNKYNSYFAIVSIQRDSKGKCKCELIKLP